MQNPSNYPSDSDAHHGSRQDDCHTASEKGTSTKTHSSRLTVVGE